VYRDGGIARQTLKQQGGAAAMLTANVHNGVVAQQRAQLLRTEAGLDHQRLTIQEAGKSRGHKETSDRCQEVSQPRHSSVHTRTAR